MADQELVGLARMRGSVKQEHEDHIKAFDEAHRGLSRLAGTILDDIQALIEQRSQGKATAEDTLGQILALTTRVSLNEVKLASEQQDRPHGFTRTGSFSTAPVRSALTDPARAAAPAPAPSLPAPPKTDGDAQTPGEAGAA